MGFLITAISLGFFGSFHCVGMCGPIALALPIGQAGFLKRTALVIAYNMGRAFTYSVFGALFGFIGQSVVIGGYQQLLSLTIGSVLLVSVILPPDLSFGGKVARGSFRFFNGIKVRLSRLFLRSGYRSLLLTGVLNGLLPCGLVYLGIAGAIATGNGLKGAAFMALFGLGTLPAMICLPLFGNFISLSLRNGIRKSMPLLVGAMAILLIIRGLNLGIPYISPKLDTKDPASCHHVLTKQTVSGKNVILCTGPNSVHKK